MPPRRTLIIAAAALTAIAFAAVSGAATPGGVGRVVQVHPGELHDALQQASDGDTLVLHHGRYRGDYEIDKRLNLVGAREERRPVIDGGCRTRVTIAVRHSGVRLRSLRVVGASEGFGPVPSEVEVAEVRSGSFSDLVLRDTCEAEYGINVFATGPLRVSENRAVGFSDGGIYVGGITDTGAGMLRVLDNDGRRNNRGIVVEDSAGGRVQIVGNDFNANTAPGEGDPAGIFFHNSDGVLVKNNSASDNGVFGLHLDSRSDRNRLFGNRMARNPSNVLDEGQANCGSGNVPNPFPACPSRPAPRATATLRPPAGAAGRAQ